MVREVTTDSRFASRCSLVFFKSKKKVVKNVKKTLSGEQSFLSGMAFSVRVACHSRSWLNELSLKCHLSLRPPPSPPPPLPNGQQGERDDVSGLSGAPYDNFRKMSVRKTF